MRLKFLSLIIIVFLFSTGAVSQPSLYRVKDLAWLTGCWRQVGQDYERLEFLLRPAGKMMVGVSHTIFKGETIEYEYLQIIEEEDGFVYLIAFPSGQNRTAFKLIESENRRALFQNSMHDFPQRIRYEKLGEDSIMARIEGVQAGKEKWVDFPMKRTLCPEPE